MTVFGVVLGEMCNPLHRCVLGWFRCVLWFASRASVTCKVIIQTINSTCLISLVWALCLCVCVCTHINVFSFVRLKLELRVFLEHIDFRGSVLIEDITTPPLCFGKNVLFSFSTVYFKLNLKPTESYNRAKE